MAVPSPSNSIHVTCIHRRVRLLDSEHPCRLGKDHGKGNPLQGGVFAAKGGSEGPEEERGDYGIHRLESLLFMVTMQRSHSMSLKEFKKDVKKSMPEHACNSAPVARSLAGPTSRPQLEFLKDSRVTQRHRPSPGERSQVTGSTSVAETHSCPHSQRGVSGQLRQVTHPPGRSNHEFHHY